MMTFTQLSPFCALFQQAMMKHLFGNRPLKYNEQTGPNRNERGSPKLRLRAILNLASTWRRAYEVRSVPTNPFDNTEKSVPVRAASLVRNLENGGGSGTGSEPSLPPKLLNSLCRPVV